MAFYTLFDQASRGWRGANLAAEEAIFGVALVVSLGLLRMSEHHRRLMTKQLLDGCRIAWDVKAAARCWHYKWNCGRKRPQNWSFSVTLTGPRLLIFFV